MAPRLVQSLLQDLFGERERAKRGGEVRLEKRGGLALDVSGGIPARLEVLFQPPVEAEPDAAGVCLVAGEAPAEAGVLFL